MPRTPSETCHRTSQDQNVDFMILKFFKAMSDSLCRHDGKFLLTANSFELANQYDVVRNDQDVDSLFTVLGGTHAFCFPA